ncbi:MAG: PDZ domain-containing protein [Pirellulaceae bacterium]
MLLRNTPLFAALVAVAFSMPAFAGDDESKRRESEKTSKHQRHSDASDQSEQRKQSPDGQRRQSDQSAKYDVSPTGWIRMAVDYNNDGQFDAVETIYTYDLERARQSSRQRANENARRMSSKGESSRDRGDMNRSQSDRSRQMASDRSRSGSSERQRETVSGKILQLRSERLMGMNEPSMVARIRTNDNMPAKIVLGPKSTIQKLDLQDGDNITVQGFKGRVNDKTMLLADSVKSGERTVRVALPSSRGAKRVRGELLDWRTTKFRGHDGEFVVAKVKCNSGKQAVVNLGSKSKIDQLNLEKGDELRMIVRPATMNDRKGMVADEVFANGKSVNVSPPKMVSRRDRQRDSDRGFDQASKSSSRKTSQQRATDQRSNNQKASEDSSTKPALGIAVRDTDDGVVILAIHPSSPAADKDIETGDEIVSINGEKIQSANDVVDLIAENDPDDKVELKTRRNDKEQTVSIRLTSLQKLMSTFR